MSNFKNIEKLGLRVHSVSGLTVVSADSLEELLQSAQVVYGLEEGGTFWWATHQLSQDTHQAILIAITPIRKQTKAEAALEFIKKCKDGDIYEMHANEVMKEAKRILEMKDEA